MTLEIWDLEIPKLKDSNESSPIPNPKDIIKYINIFQDSVEKIDIRNLQVPKIFQGDILYQNQKLEIAYQHNILNTEIFSDKEKLYLKIKKLYIFKEQINLNGEIIFNSENNETLISSNISLKNIINLSVFGIVDNFKNVQIFATSEKIKTLKPIFDILKLSKPAYIWGIDRAKFEYIKLDRVSTHFPISNPNLALANLKVDGRIRKLKYIFEPKLNPIFSETVKIQIRDKNLNLNLEKLKFGKNYLQNQIFMKNLFSKPHLFVEVHSKIGLDRNLLKTIKHYSKLEKLPVSISNKLGTDFYFDMKLYDDLPMRFIANLNIKKANPKSKTLPNINGGKIKFRFPENILKTENILFSYQNLANGKISGLFNIPKSEINFNAIIKKVRIDENSSMKSRDLKLHLFGNLHHIIKADISKSNWKFANIETQLSKFHINFDLKNIEIQNLKTKIDEYNLSTKIDAKYNLDRKYANINLGIRNLKFSELNISNEEFRVFVDLKKDITVKIPKLLTNIYIAESKTLDFGDIGLFNKYLPITKKYPKVSGNLHLEISKDIKLDGSIFVKQRIIKDENSFVEYFNFNGKISGEEMQFSVNDKIFIDKSQSINILIKDYDFNLTGINDFIDMNSSDEVNETQEKDETPLNIEPEINIYLKDNAVFLTDSGNIFDTKSVFVTVFKNKAYIKTDVKGRGRIQIESQDKRYILKAVNLDEKFIKNISNFDGISGGYYNLYVKGENANLTGIAQFQELKIMNLDMVNNILAFINTVPALLTFSRPGFNHNGLRILAGYILFEKLNDKIYFRDIKIKGESVDFSGKGYIDLKNQKINMRIEISAIKYVDKFIGNIPIANYLILGDDESIATRILIRGDLTDPKISSELHKDILYTPVELTKRVFNLPVKILELFKELNLNDKQNQDNVKKFLNQFRFSK